MKYLIAYELEDCGEEQLEQLLTAIYSFNDSASNCFGNVWLVETTANSGEIKHRLIKHLTPNDKLIVSAAGDTEFAGFGSEMTAWMIGRIDE